MNTIDLNCDLGEDPGESTRDEALLELVTSANVACGGHAGDEDSMEPHGARRAAAGVALGAHPSYPDREHFGRRELEMSARGRSRRRLRAQVESLADVAARGRRRARPRQAARRALQPRGARSARRRRHRRGSRRRRSQPRAGRPRRVAALATWRAQGLRAAAEAFADRRYEPDGALRARRFADALISDPAAAAAQAVAMARDGVVDTICVHSDTPGALAILTAVRGALTSSGVMLRANGDVVQ